MAILVMCSNSQCGELIDVPEEAAGTQLACPVCGTMLHVPGPAVQPSPKEEQPAAPADARARPEQPDAPAAPPAAEERPEPAAPAAPTDEEALDLAREEAPQLSVSSEMAELLRETSKPAVEEQVDLSPDIGGSADLPAQPSVAEPPAAPADKDETDLAGLIDDTLALLPPEEIAPAASAGSVDEGVLEHEPVSAVPFIIGLLGMACGLAVGIFGWPGQRIVGAYAGAGLGWMAGFTFGFMVVFAIDRGGIRMIRCTVCDNLFPVGTRTCRLCGSVLSAKLVNPLATECAQAGSYALSNLTGVYWMSIFLVIGSLLFQGVWHLRRAYPQLPGPVWAALFGLCGVFGVCAIIYWVAFFCSAIRGTLARADKKFTAPDFWSLDSFRMGLKGIVVLVGYTLPVITLPLLPLSLLSVGWPKGRLSLLPSKALGRLSRSTRDAVVLWLFLLVWLAGLALSAAVAQVALNWLDAIMPKAEGPSGTALSMVYTAIWTGVMTAVISIFCLAVGRCIGMFGRFNHIALSGAARANRSVKPMTGGGGDN